ncbi:MAG TPA: NAD-dependent epimerase/dehydratase family protein [Candidatus Cloacimonetes bacterium]|nr:NAD-dependent epimerase/dehydratase family protein [Candidatus Cloacimonadota bacterium]HEX38231.1 NAD-dependent epimerase/dehydratase family protein [Candidatus Cloacimonadota bacterium]
MKKKVLVTGANGFVGSNLVRALLKERYEVTCLVRKTSNLETLEGLPVTFANSDYHSVSSLHEACKGQDIIFHIAAKVREISQKRYFDANVAVTSNLMKAIHGSSVEKCVFLSTQAAAGPCSHKYSKTEDDVSNPVSYYGKSKLEAEKVIKNECPVPWVIVRPSSVYGPGDKDFFKYFELIEKGIAPLAGFKKKYISLIFTEDLIDLLIKCMEKDVANDQVFFASDGAVYSFDDFIDTLTEVMKKKVVKVRVPIFLSYTGAFFNECRKFFTGKQAILNIQKVKEARQLYWLCSIDKAKKTLQFQPKTTLEEGLEKTYIWYKEHGWL